MLTLSGRVDWKKIQRVDALKINFFFSLTVICHVHGKNDFNAEFVNMFENVDRCKTHGTVFKLSSTHNTSSYITTVVDNYRTISYQKPESIRLFENCKRN